MAYYPDTLQFMSQQAPNLRNFPQYQQPVFQVPTMRDFWGASPLDFLNFMTQQRNMAQAANRWIRDTHRQDAFRDYQKFGRS